MPPGVGGGVPGWEKLPLPGMPGCVVPGWWPPGFPSWWKRGCLASLGQEAGSAAKVAAVLSQKRVMFGLSEAQLPTSRQATLAAR